MTDRSCPFCPPDPERVFLEGDAVLALWDAFPVTDGHALVILRRHVASWFDATPDEQLQILRAVAEVRREIEKHRDPHGYNIGVNVGAAAGQTVAHLHVHVIPRYAGDVPDARGGVRHVIPGRGTYLSRPRAAEDAPLPRALVQGGERDPLLPHLVAHLDRATRVDIAAAFVLESGVRLVEEHLRDVLDRGGRVRILTGDYLGVTDPAALFRLLDLEGDVHLRVFQTAGASFHPKAYILGEAPGAGAAFVGSSNLTETALRRGVEWNYRVVPARDESGFAEVVRAFETLWAERRCRPLDAAWVQAYAERRTGRPPPRETGVEPEPLQPAIPHAVQLEALAALEETREAGNTAGLVVLATGLGKTWLSAFDSQRADYRRVLFVAHREEILRQAMRTFRRIRPLATFGHYDGREKAPDADVLFASIQTLSRRQHLHRFDPRRFDYLIVDEFHHAAAASYRRLIAYFEPRFLLGLTATPERTDGADLLALCGGNLVYRSDVPEGIRRGLLSPFAYYGVPDEVDYANIPWRSQRFDEEALTTAVATRARAENALEQLRRHGRERAIAFCVSQRHADFMADFFEENGLRAAAVHAGPRSAPRAHSLERLEAGELDVVCSVDMFNEGVDLPHVDTVLMLRPTESRILWLQQFGRGLRRLPGKTLRVIDYIGNHRVFLTKTQALLGLGNADREVAFALDRLEAGTFELPPGCSVTYELKATDILRSLLRTAPAGEQLEVYYADYRERYGARPQAPAVFLDGFNPRAARRFGYGSWLEFVDAMGDLTPEQRNVRGRIGAFLAQLETTPMTRSYKMLVLLGMLAEDALPGTVSLERLAERFADGARRYAALRTEVGDALDDPAALRRLLREHPIRAWAGGAGTGQTPYFAFDGEHFSTTFTLPDALREPAQELVQEIAEWRLAEYLQRMPAVQDADRFTCRVSHAGGRPILFLPDRARNPGIPEGWREVRADDRWYQANFVKVAVNVMHEPGGSENLLGDVLRGWFGADAGRPGRSDAVVFERRGTGYVMRPATAEDAQTAGPVPWSPYNRDEALSALGVVAKGWDRQVGIVDRPDQVILFVTLDKKGRAETLQYQDRFLSPTEFQWQSQNKNRRESELGRKLHDHKHLGVPVHLFVRRADKVRGQTQPFLYGGPLEFQRWEGDGPVTVWWRVVEAVPEEVWGELGVEG